MPIYEYVCNNCGHETDIIQKLSDPEIITCPECNTENFNKIVSAPSFRLKGTGWYETDFKNPKKTSDDKQPASSGKSDSNTATKATKSAKNDD